MRVYSHTCPVTGIVATAEEHAKRLGLKHGKALRGRWYRLGKGNPEAWAPSVGRGHNRDIPIRVNGRVYRSRAAACRATGVPETTMKRRMAAGVQGERLVRRDSVLAHIHTHPETGDRRTAREWAAELHIDPSTFRRRVGARGGSDPVIYDPFYGRADESMRAEIEARRVAKARREEARREEAAETLRGFAEEMGLV